MPLNGAGGRAGVEYDRKAKDDNKGKKEGRLDRTNDASLLTKKMK